MQLQKALAVSQGRNKHNICTEYDLRLKLQDFGKNCAFNDQAYSGKLFSKKIPPAGIVWKALMRLDHCLSSDSVAVVIRDSLNPTAPVGS